MAFQCDKNESVIIWKALKQNQRDKSLFKTMNVKNI